MRPKSLNDYAGQKHILHPGSLLRRVIESDRLSSIILYGPPGTGKTTLALIIARETKANFEALNAVASNVQEMRQTLKKAHDIYQLNNKKTILFIDEIHRFNKAQQDILMPDIEKGNPILIGATTHNPFFSIVAPLLSRSLIFELKPLTKEDLEEVLLRALRDKEKGLGNYPVKMHKEALDFFCEVSDGDARRMLNALEIGVKTTPPTNSIIDFTLEVAQESIQKKAVLYDHDEDAHYDTISAFIKSMRGSDPDAAIYWLAKMLYAGEDPRFIARRIVICAAEDVGNADPMALVVANAALQVSEFVGMPEARIPLAQAVTYIACAPKSNAAYMAIENATTDIKEGRLLEIPAHLRDASYKSAKKLGHGEGYKYAHDYENHHVAQDYLIEKRSYYKPTTQGKEKDFKAYLESLKAASSKPPGFPPAGSS